MPFTLEQLETVHNAQRSTKIWVGAGIGVFLIAVFFTFATLIDKMPPIYFKIEVMATLVAIPLLFVLDQISFFWIRRKFSNSPYRELVMKLQPGDVDEKPEKVLGILNGGRD